MSYQVLARKWRPANFKQMVGQEHVVQALVNALDADRLHHAYLFSGTRGVGKTTIARIFAKSLNCESGITSEPCGQCSSCIEIDEGRSVDLIEIDAASRTGVDDMRELLDNVQYAPTRGRFKIYLIDEVHMLSRHSFNALLKTLEEPPPHIKFLVATTDPQKLPVTVLSRCLQFNLKRMTRAQILAHLQFLIEQESLESDAAALAQIATAADGSMRDGLSLLDQAIGYGGGAVRQAAVESMLGSISHDYLARLFDGLVAQDAVSLLTEARGVIEYNPDFQRVCAEMIALLQQVALYQTDSGLVEDSEFDPQLLQKYASHWSAEEIQLYYQILLQGRQDLLACPDEGAGFEMLMLRLLAFSPRADSSQAIAPAEVKKKPELSVNSIAPGLTETATHEANALIPPEPALDKLSEPVVDTSPEPLAVMPVEADDDLPAAESDSPPRQAAGANPESVTAAASGDSLDWSQLAYDLELGGLAQEIVANSLLESFQQGRLQLGLAPELQELVTARVDSEISAALERKLGVSLELVLRACDALAGTTPLQAREQRLEQERLEAIAAIRQEKIVRKLQQTLAAELDESSVVRIEN